MPITGIGRYTDSTRHYVRLNNGDIVSRQTAENLFAEQYGFRNVRDQSKAMHSQGFRSFQTRPGYNRAWNEAKAAGTSKADFNAAMARYYSDPRNRIDDSPNGAKAQMLQALGRRSPGSEYRVGESPSVM